MLQIRERVFDFKLLPLKIRLDYNGHNKLQLVTQINQLAAESPARIVTTFACSRINSYQNIEKQSYLKRKSISLFEQTTCAIYNW